MQYCGGKARIAKQIAEIINDYDLPIVEPFCGGINCTQYFTGKIEASDFNQHLVTTLQAVQSGWMPPEIISEATWNELRDKNDPTNPLTAFASFSCSFSGKWFSSFQGIKEKSGRQINFAKMGKNSLLRKMSRCKDVIFSFADYRSLKPFNNVVYCAPPYRNTYQTYPFEKFDSDEFWNIMRKWSKDNVVIVSEFTAPEDFYCLKEFRLNKTNLFRSKDKEPRIVIEKLFTIRQ